MWAGEGVAPGPSPASRLQEAKFMHSPRAWRRAQSPCPFLNSSWDSCISLWHSAWLPSWDLGACFSALPPRSHATRSWAPFQYILEAEHRTAAPHLRMHCLPVAIFSSTNQELLVLPAPTQGWLRLCLAVRGFPRIPQPQIPPKPETTEGWGWVKTQERTNE